MRVDLIDSMGSDLTVVNAARVSFNKQHTEVEKGDTGLIKFLANHGHWSPFAHCFIQFRIKAPIFVARQLQKHQIGLSWNEISRRYVSYAPEFWSPLNGWRKAAKDKKQGSGGLSKSSKTADKYSEDVNKICITYYNRLLEDGICEEQARSVLPQGMLTEWFWSGSLYAFSRVCNLRTSSDAQEETKEIALRIHEECAILYPKSWRALTFNYEIGEG